MCGGGPQASGETDVFKPAIEPKPNVASQTRAGTTTVGTWDCWTRFAGSAASC
jgi:hypothetical protein